MVHVATWNVNNRGVDAAARLGAFVRRNSIELLLLQEANVNALDLLVKSAGLDWSVTAFEAGAPLSTTGRRRTSAIAGRGTAPELVGVLPDVQHPEKAVYARVTLDDQPVTVCAYHAPPGVSWGIEKVKHAHALGTWIDASTGPMIVGADANTPEVDHPSREQVRTHWHTGTPQVGAGLGDDVVFGGNPTHRLRDGLRTWFDEHPDELARVSEQYPTGPLAVSHRTGKRRDYVGTARRFDALWLSDEWQVQSINYDFSGAIAAGSDHALVVAELRLR